MPSDFVIYDEQDSIDLLRQCIKESGINPDAAFWQLSQIKSDCPVTSLSLAEIPPLDMTGLSDALRAGFNSYHKHLAERHALDFCDLLYRTRAMFASSLAKREKRLFYAAITRAKRHLVVTSHLNNQWNRKKPPSGFLYGLFR